MGEPLPPLPPFLLFLETPVGAALVVGAADGNAEGVAEGCGEVVGVADGLGEGPGDGAGDGAAEGLGDGAADGEGLGCGLGWADGEVVGAGEIEGAGDGASDGMVVGDADFLLIIIPLLLPLPLPPSRSKMSDGSSSDLCDNRRRGCDASRTPFTRLVTKDSKSPPRTGKCCAKEHRRHTRAKRTISRDRPVTGMVERSARNDVHWLFGGLGVL